MKKSCCLSLFLLVLSSFALLAQQPAVRKSAQAAPPKPSAEKPSLDPPNINSPNREQVLKLLDLLKVRDTIKITIEATRQQVQGNAEETFREKVITFYSSPVGQKVLREQSAMVRESMAATAAGQQRKMESLMARLELRVQQLALEEQNKNTPEKK